MTLASRLAKIRLEARSFATTLALQAAGETTFDPTSAAG
jgi:hypothetical protein